MSAKRKDFTPKKNEQNASAKRCNIEVVDLTSVDDGEDRDYSGPKEHSVFSRKKLFCDDESSVCSKVQVENPEKFMKIEPDDNSGHIKLPENSQNSPDLEEPNESVNAEPDYYRDDIKLPKYSEDSPDLEEIFKVCLLKKVPDDKVVKVKPTRVKDTATFVVKQDAINLKHPYDLEADDTPGAFVKNGLVRFYQVKIKENQDMEISSEVRVTKDKRGDVISGTYNRRKNNAWKPKTAKMSKLYAVVRKRAVHKPTLKEYNSAFTRYIIYVMPVNEYNQVHGKLKSLKEYKLSLNIMITHYYFNTGCAVPIVSAKHGNATKEDTPVFRPTEHSLKQECKEAVATTNATPRLLAQSLGDADVSIIESSTGSGRV